MMKTSVKNTTSTPRALWLLVAVVLVIGLSGGAARADNSCKACGKTISGTAIEVGDLSYHPHHLVCKFCDREISGRFTTYKRDNFHDECFENNVALRCGLCQGVISGEYIIDYWGNGYHKRHQGVSNSCDYCSRFISDEITGGGVRYSDGRMICNLCHKDAVTTVSEAKRLMLEVARHLHDSGISVDPGKVTLHIMGLTDMQRLSGKGSHSLMGFTDYLEKKTLFGISRSRKIDVYVLYGIPRMDMISTLAHELAHVFQFVNGKLNNDRAFSEGSCNYAAYLVLQNYEKTDRGYIIHNMLEDNDPVYGEGFRRVRRFASAEGDRAWISRLKKRKDLPTGF